MSDPAASSPNRLPADPLGTDAPALRQDLGQEYYAILGVVKDFDQRFLTIKGWSVTLSLAALGLGFNDQHAAFFALAAFSGLSFWVLEALAKRHQLRYYSRMRDIEVACFHLNRVALPQLGEVSSPRIDMSGSGREPANLPPRRRFLIPDLRKPAPPRRALGETAREAIVRRVAGASPPPGACPLVSAEAALRR